MDWSLINGIYLEIIIISFYGIFCCHFCRISRLQIETNFNIIPYVNLDLVTCNFLVINATIGMNASYIFRYFRIDRLGVLLWGGRDGALIFGKL